MAYPTVSPAAMRVVKLLVGSPPKTVADLMEATDVTRTAVTEQLNELVAAGFVERDSERLEGRGRPRHLYKVTDAALLLLFASNQHLLVPAIWQAIEDVGGAKLTKKIIKHVSRTMADHYSRRVMAKKPEDRFRELTQLLQSDGALIEVTEDEGQLVLHKRSCLFLPLYGEKPANCNVDLEMMSEVVGSPVRRTACRHDGAPCCTFEIVPKQ
ncbi:MAG TPA: MarR family transcriptional regulator [Thermoguttaceae bacterium]|nr:MarR family transcriptional regulator [Thermoguttaceae bacterium]